MEEGYIRNEEDGRDEIFSRAVRAGKRTYFFDVKATQKNDYYLTVTESKRRYDQTGHFRYEKHKIFLYKEDFDKFTEGLAEVIDFIRSTNREIAEEVSGSDNDFIDVEFDDLEN